jgi:alpha-D-ribose 1-methylphosphonate 5-triphosphate diphosphatase
MARTLLKNARTFLPDRLLDRATVVIEDTRIVDVLPDARLDDPGIDLGGTWLLPGFIDIHTDYLEKEINPRPQTNFPLELAFHFMDLRAISSGLTTVLGAVRVSDEKDGGPNGSIWRRNGLELGREYDRLAPHYLARHRIHVRWDTNFEPCDEAIAALRSLKTLGNIVFNENIPGQRQFRNLEDIARKRAARGDLSLEEAMAQLEEKIAIASQINNRPAVAEAFAGRVLLGSHDDTTEAHVVEARETGCRLAEMPTTLEAARKARELGQWICMGSPNYYRGGSHCGNLSCHQALEEDLVDILCSDYHFPSLLGSFIKMLEAGIAPDRAVNLFTLNPARALGWDASIGSIEPGKLADLIAVQPGDGYGRVLGAWVGGIRRFSADEPPAPPHPEKADPLPRHDLATA